MKMAPVRCQLEADRYLTGYWGWPRVMLNRGKPGCCDDA